MWSHLHVLVSRRAAAFCTDCTFLSRFSDTPYRGESIMSIFIPLYLKPAVHISFSRSIFHMVWATYSCVVLWCPLLDHMTSVETYYFLEQTKTIVPIRTFFQSPVVFAYCNWSAWLRGRTSVSGQRSFAILCSTCS